LYGDKDWCKATSVWGNSCRCILLSAGVNVDNIYVN